MRPSASTKLALHGIANAIVRVYDYVPDDSRLRNYIIEILLEYQ
jgi:hypothetical protein